MQAPNRADTATPARISRTGRIPFFYAKTYTSPAAAMAPQKAAGTINEV